MSGLAKIVGDLGNIEEFKITDEFLIIVNQDPPKSQMLNHPFAQGVKYLPIAVVETMLTKLFQYWNIEVLREGQLLNSVYVTIRLHYKHPISGLMTFQDGLGAVAIQVEKGMNASDLGAIRSNAIMLGLPAAKSFAIKDAAEHIGKVFGRDMNRKDTIAFSPSYAHADVNVSNQMVLVDQIKQLELMSEEYSGLVGEDAANWFFEIVGVQYSQVRKFEFDAVMTKLKQERTTPENEGV